MVAGSIPKTKTGGNTCLDIRVDLNINCVEDEEDVEATPKESSSISFTDMKGDLNQILSHL